MFDGLIEVLMSWLSSAFCWIVTALFGAVGLLFDAYALVAPSIPVPAWLTTSNPFLDSSLQLFAYFFPAQVILYIMSAYVAYELGTHILIPVFRTFMDLL